MLNRNALSLLLFVSLVAAGCAPKTTRKPLPTLPPSTESKDQGSTTPPEPRNAPSNTPASPTPTPPSTTPVAPTTTPAAPTTPAPTTVTQIGPTAPTTTTPAPVTTPPAPVTTTPAPTTPAPVAQVGPPAPATTTPAPTTTTPAPTTPAPTDTTPAPITTTDTTTPGPVVVTQVGPPVPAPTTDTTTPAPTTTTDTTTPTPQTPAQALAHVGDPVTPAPEAETKPGLAPFLWMRLHGDGDQKFEVEMNIVAMPPIKEGRGGTTDSNARFLSYDFAIRNLDGQSTNGAFEFRHPLNGVVETFHVNATSTPDQPTEALHTATEATKNDPHPFEIQIRIPINEVTEEMLFTAAESFRDFAARDAKYEKEWQAILDGLEKPGATLTDVEQLKADIKVIKAQIDVLNGTTEDKRADSQIRLAINKYQVAEYMLKPAFRRWGEIFEDKACEEDLDPAKSKPEPNCHGKIWVRQKRLADIKEFYRYLDKQGTAEQPATAEHHATPAQLSTADRLVDEYLKAESARKAVERAQQTQTQQPVAPGEAIPPMAPPPPAQSTELDFPVGRTQILLTDAVDSGTAVTQPNRIKLVFVGDAFAATQAETFYEEAQKKWDYLFGNTAVSEKRPAQAGVEPFRTYKKYFMGLAISTISQQSKALHPENGEEYKAGATALESKFDNFNIQRLLGMSKEGYRKMGNLLRAKVPDYDLAAIIVNDPQYGGAGGTYAMVSLDRNANEVIAHELMGHSFAKLGDEYSDPYPSFPAIEEPNTMKDSTKEEGAKWASHMLKHKSELATAAPDESDLIKDVVLGAHYNPTGWWRPFQSCKMRVLGQPFCSVCRDTIIKSIYNKIKPIDSASTSPAPNDKGVVSVKPSESWILKIQTLQPEQPVNANASTSVLKIQWLVGSSDCEHAKPIDGATSDTLTAETAKLQPGKYKVCAKVSDTNIDVTKLGAEELKVNPLEQVRAFDLRIN